MIKDTYNAWSKNKSPRMAAALAYYSLFAMAPLLVIIIEIAALIIGHGQASGHHAEVQETLVRDMEMTLGHAGAKTVADIIQSTVDQQGAGIFSSIVGWIVLMFAAGGLFGALQDALNTVWEVPVSRTEGWGQIIRGRFASFAIIAVLALVLLLSLFCNAILTTFSGVFEKTIPETQLLVSWLNKLIAFGLATLLFAIIFKFLPDAEVEWGDVLIGATATSLLFALGQTLLALYMANLGASSTFGAAGSLAVLLLWVYYSAQLLLFGAEFTHVYARRRDKASLVAGENPDTELLCEGGGQG